MDTTEKLNQINATSKLLQRGYNTQRAGGQITTAYCDVLPRIELREGMFVVQDGSGQAYAETYATAEEAVEAALLWFASCCLGYTVSSVDDADAADYVAIALGDRGAAWDRFRGFETVEAE